MVPRSSWGAKKFLVDYISNFRKAFLASEYYNFPCFAQTVPDLKKLVAYDKKAQPPDKYKILEDVQDWVSPEDALKAADKKVQGIFKKWRARGMV
jgi:multiple sugar transport system substrate-binding protein